MQPMSRIYLTDDAGQKFFGEGPYRLLCAVEETGSLRAAAISMEMAYSKANKLIKSAEAALGFPLLERAVGGRDGGGSRLTEAGSAWIARYEAYRNACLAANQRLFEEYYPSAKFGCVIMASGFGKRFGGNKLLADFGGRPMISRVLDATEGLFTTRVVVTRHPEVKELCEARGIKVVLHDLPLRSDTVRLGMEALPKGLSGCMFCTGDQPLVSHRSIQTMLAQAAFQTQYIYRLAFGDAVGSPVLFPASDFEELCHLPSGKGGNVILQREPERVRLVQAEREEELEDVDCPADLERLLKGRDE